MLSVALLVVSLVGLALSVHTVRAMRCSGSPSCDLVMSTRYARIFGFPNAVIAAAYYGALVVFAVDRLLRGPVLPLWLPLAASAASILMSAFLAWALFVKLGRF